MIRRGIEPRGSNEVVLATNEETLAGEGGVERLLLLDETKLVRRHCELALVVLSVEWLGVFNKRLYVLFIV